jgi:hypothetical protein
MGTAVTLNGTGSTDPDGDPLTFFWSAPGIIFDDPTNPSPTATFPLGTHTITLTVDDGKGGSATDEVEVTVVDTTPPVITVNGEAEVTVECHTAYADAGATATDLCDGTLLVTIENPVDVNVVGTYTVTYTATDKSGNTTTATRTMHVVDTTPPVLTLNGVTPMMLECPAPYVEPGATVSDDCDPSPVLTITGSVDPHRPGTYTITYTATDASRNVSTTTRTVHVVDTTPPVVTCSLTPTTNPANQPAGKGKVPAGQNPNQPAKVGNPDGFFLVTYAAKDACDPNPVTTATICGFPVADGEKIKYTQAPGQTVPKLVLIGPEKIKHIICSEDPTLIVTSTDASGNTTTHACSATVPPPAAKVIPAVFALGQNYPNPFNPETTISYDLPEETDVYLVIYDLMSRTVRALVYGYQQPGRHEVVWDGRDENGREVASGVYLYRLEERGRGVVATRRMLLLR